MTIRSLVTRAVQRMWQSRGVVSTALLPLAWLTALFVRQKARRFRSHPERIWQSRIPIAVVGNIYVGGTGKTPVVMALVQALRQRGWTPGVISRGYGVDVGPDVRVGQGVLDPELFGDEPALIARHTSAPVAVHPVRSNAVQALERQFPHVDVIVADDGLQHLALGRDIEIVVQDQRGVGNGRLLPAGPLREPARRLNQVDAVITNLAAECTRPEPLNAANGHDRAGTVLKISMTLEPCAVVHVRSGQQSGWKDWLSKQQDAPVAAVAAIGHPERFFVMLRDQGLQLTQTVPLPDHASLSAASFRTIKEATILVTAKDAVKCHGIDDDRLFSVKVAPRFSDPRWFDVIHHRLSQAARRRRAMAEAPAKH